MDPLLLCPGLTSPVLNFKFWWRHSLSSTPPLRFFVILRRASGNLVIEENGICLHQLKRNNWEENHIKIFLHYLWCLIDVDIISIKVPSAYLTRKLSDSLPRASDLLTHWHTNFHLEVHTFTRNSHAINEVQGRSTIRETTLSTKISKLDNGKSNKVSVGFTW